MPKVFLSLCFPRVSWGCLLLPLMLLLLLALLFMPPAAYAEHCAEVAATTKCTGQCC